MSKRALPPASLPPAKRLHTVASQLGTTETAKFSFNDSLYDELILCIFSHLSWVDLCAAHATSTNWRRLASDNTLWKNLYLAAFGRSRLRGSRGYVTRSDGREIRPLPGRVQLNSESTKDWKEMFRISSNWKNGRCVTEELEGSQPLAQVSNSEPPSPSFCEIHVLLAGSLTIFASSRPSDLPTINLSTSTNKFRLECESSSGSGPHQITTLAIDQSPPLYGHLRLAAFLSNGEFSVFSVNPANLSSSVRKLTYLPSRARSRGSPAIQSVYNHPLLVTLSHDETFSIALYDLSGNNIVRTQTLTSFTSFPPSSIVLSMASPTTYKLVLAYTVPVYPAHWSIGATELIISGPRTSSPSSPTSTFSQTSADPMCVVSTRSIRALDVPPGFFDDDKLRSLREQYGRKVSCVTDTQTDGKWVVLAPAETTPASTSSISFSSIPSSINTQDASFLNSSTSLQLYRLYLPPTSSSVAAPAPKLTFVRSLHGQTGPIESLALADGRCISLGLNGSLWVWDLEAGTGAEISASNSERMINSTCTRMVAFDEKRIVTTEGARMVVHRFDI
ncbi:hypothetical protein C0991_001648 [Blastosporella zonata]|nr:hypothetical protein C0991_001648 [Blastosporella zonata]